MDIVTLGLRLDDENAAAKVREFGNASQKAAAQATQVEAASKRTSAVIREEGSLRAAIAQRLRVEGEQRRSLMHEEALQAASQRRHHQRRIVELEREHQATLASNAVKRAASLAESSLVNNAKVMTATHAAQAAAMQKTEVVARRLREGISSLAFSFVGAAPGVAGLTSILGSMALGSAVMIGVLAGLAALAKAWELITAKSREAKKAQDEAVTAARAIALEQSQGLLGGSLATVQGLNAAEAAANNKLRELQREAAGVSSMTLGDAARSLNPFRRLGDEIKAAEKFRDDVVSLRKSMGTKMQQITDGAAKEAADKAEAARRKEEQALKEHLDTLEKLRLKAAEIRVRESRIMTGDSMAGGGLGGGFGLPKSVTDALRNQNVGEGAIRAGGASTAPKAMQESVSALRQYATAARDTFRDLQRIYAGGNAGLGALQGAISGFSMSGGNPIATAVGAFAGLAAGILGAGKAAREAAREMYRLKESFGISLEGLRAEVGGEGSWSALNFELLQLDQRLETLREEAIKLFEGDDEAARIKEINRLGAQRAQQLIAEYEALKRVNEEQERQQQYDKNIANLDKGIASGTRVIEQELARYLAELDAQSAVLQKQLDVAQESLRLQEQEIEQTKRVLDSLAKFAAGLSLGPLSTMSPVQQLEEARRQYDQTLASAYGGNKDAALGLPDAARGFLEASRGVNASGPAYVKDFQRVQATLAGVTDQFGAQLSVEQMMLKQLEAQTAAVQAQLAAINAARAQAQADAQRQIDALGNVKALLEQGNAGPLVNPPRFPGPDPVVEQPGSQPPPRGGGLPALDSRSSIAVLQEGFRQTVAELALVRAELAETTRQVKKGREALL